MSSFSNEIKLLSSVSIVLESMRTTSRQEICICETRLALKNAQEKTVCNLLGNDVWQDNYEEVRLGYFFMVTARSLCNRLSCNLHRSVERKFGWEIFLLFLLWDSYFSWFSCFLYDRNFFSHGVTGAFSTFNAMAIFWFIVVIILSFERFFLLFILNTAIRSADVPHSTRNDAIIVCKQLFVFDSIQQKITSLIDRSCLSHKNASLCLNIRTCIPTKSVHLLPLDPV